MWQSFFLLSFGPDPPVARAPGADAGFRAGVGFGFAAPAGAASESTCHPGSTSTVCRQAGTIVVQFISVPVECQASSVDGYVKQKFARQDLHFTGTRSRFLQPGAEQPADVDLTVGAGLGQPASMCRMTFWFGSSPFFSGTGCAQSGQTGMVTDWMISSPRHSCS